MHEIKTPRQEEKARTAAGKILAELSILDPGKSNIKWDKISDADLEAANLFLTEALHQVALESSKRQGIDVSVHIDHKPDETA